MSENDLEITGEPSHTVEEPCTTNSTGAASGETEAPAKKAKIMLTEKQQAFVKMFQPAASKIDKPRNIEIRHVLGKGACLLQINSYFTHMHVLESEPQQFGYCMNAICRVSQAIRFLRRFTTLPTHDQGVVRQDTVKNVFADFIRNLVMDRDERSGQGACS